MGHQIERILPLCCEGRGCDDFFRVLKRVNTKRSISKPDVAYTAEVNYVLARSDFPAQRFTGSSVAASAVAARVSTM
jgi:hypothetical protein